MNTTNLLTQRWERAARKLLLTVLAVGSVACLADPVLIKKFMVVGVDGKLGAIDVKTGNPVRIVPPPIPEGGLPAVSTIDMSLEFRYGATTMRIGEGDALTVATPCPRCLPTVSDRGHTTGAAAAGESCECRR